METVDEDKIGTCPSDISLIGRAPGCAGCPGQQLCQSQGGVDSNQSAINIRMKVVKHKVLILSGKGGVGKSTVSACLAHLLAADSPNRVALLDVDLCGPSAPALLGVSPGATMQTSQWGWKPLVAPGDGGIKVVSASALLPSPDDALVFRGPRKSHLIIRFLKDVLWGKLDYLLVDTPPGTSDEHLSTIRLLQPSGPLGALLVTTPQPLAMKTAEKEVNFCKKMKLPILGVVENMAQVQCPCCQTTERLYDGDVQTLCDKHNIPLLGRIPFSFDLVQECERGISLADPSSSPAFNELNKIKTRLKDILSSQ